MILKISVLLLLIMCKPLCAMALELDPESDDPTESSELFEQAIYALIDGAPPLELSAVETLLAEREGVTTRRPDLILLLQHLNASGCFEHSS
jgi:hypothetical protein